MVEGFEHSGPAELICSAKGCRAPAAYELCWNNPKLHEKTARKTWLACTAHRDSLSHFLDSRGFLREVRPIGTAATPNSADATDAATT